MRMINDERAVTVTLETILLFTITVMMLGMVMLSFDSINDRASETVMREQYASIGNDVASKIVDMDVEIKASLLEDSVVEIRKEMNLPTLIANKPYEIEISTGKITVSSASSPFVTVIVPLDPDVNVANGSKVHSMVAEHILIYEHSGQIMFENGGVDAILDDIWPTISILTPYNNARVVGIETITVLALDINGISRVEYYIDGYYQTTVSDSPYSWEWNTYYTSDDSYTVTAMVYDRAGHYSSDTRTYYVDNGVDFVPPTGEIVSPLNGTITDYNPVLIEAIVRDNFAINFSSIKIELYNGSDWEDITTHSNTTITNTSLTEYTIRYLHSTQFANDTYGVYVYAEEQFYEYPDENKNKNVTLEWNFTIIPINDINNPTVEITFPLNPIHLVVGDYIEVGYDITDTSDNDSGIDYFIINVTYNSTEVYTHRENVSSYQNVVYETSGFYEFPQKYVDHGWYEYNITVYDRAGNSADYEIETLNSSFSQAYYLVVDNNDTDPLAKIVTFKIRSNGQNIYIDVLDISMPDDNSLTVIKFDSQKQLNQEKPIPYELTVNPVKMLTTTYMY
ncbi:MAG: Ig-like domain-containing protein, partial [ANME-2 cluster archaeon]|nr:Ig-like domain-containing protein [ANME-2 cluster archaeon]